MLLDIGVGILAALWLHEPILLGIIFSLLPDVDMLISLVRYRGSAGVYKHRDLLHLPIVYVLVGLALYPFSPSTALLYIVCSLAHFLHDSIGLGWGVQWLWPFSRNHFSFLYVYQPSGKPALPRKMVYRWRHEEIESLDKIHGDPDWIRHIYLDLHPFAIIEIAVFVCACIVAYTHV
jgi:hypothetical protein